MLCLFESSDLVAGGSIPEGVDTFSVTIFSGIWGGEFALFMFYMFTHKT
jgi:hypothetical protein